MTLPELHLHVEPDDFPEHLRSYIHQVEETRFKVFKHPFYTDLIPKRPVTAFLNAKRGYAKLNSQEARNHFLSQNIRSDIARFKNSVMGTLASGLSEGVDLETAVKKFESKVAPENYKRPRAVITPRMIEAALETLRKLDLEQAIDRRHARLSDISVNDVLFADHSAREQMKDGLADLLMQEAKPKAPRIANFRSISIEDFIADVLPQASSLDLLVENKHAGNFMSATAPVHEDSGSLFKWGNDLSWSYDGEVTDSLRQRVKNAGGRVEGALMRVSLGWYNTDDLDIHVYEPNGNHIYYANKGDKLDVDMNAFGSYSREAVENVSGMKRPTDGTYNVTIDNYHKRESVDVGFELEVVSGGRTWRFAYEKALKDRVEALTITVKNGLITEIKAGTSVTNKGEQSQEKWGIKTMALSRVTTMMLSPNHWNGKEAGNKHVFLLDGCRNLDPVRGIYNEFLSPAFEKHRKVFEVLGAKTKAPFAEEQLSGLGFSSTRQDEVIVVAWGKTLHQPYKITF